MDTQALPISLVDLLRNSLILHQISPYLPVSSILAVAATCRNVRNTLYDAPETFRYLDLSTVKSALVPDVAIDSGGVNWRSQRMDEALTQDEFCAGPLRGIFSFLERKKVLSHVQTLILDGLSVTAELVQELLCDDRFSALRILSIRETPQLNQRKLRQVLEYVVRPSRPEWMPRLRGLYVFGSKNGERFSTTTGKISHRRGVQHAESDTGVMASQGAQLGANWNHKSQNALNAELTQCEDRWYQRSGRMFEKEPEQEWANTLKKCENIIHFDAVLCRGPRHLPMDLSHDALGEQAPLETFLPPAIATVALGRAGCVKCGSTPEGPARYGESPPCCVPLLEPPPLHNSTVQQAQKPRTWGEITNPPLFARCPLCLDGRFCERCLKFWDEQCLPSHGCGTRTKEVSEHSGAGSVSNCPRSGMKTHMGLCVESCLIGEMMQGAGSFGMWG